MSEEQIAKLEQVFNRIKEKAKSMETKTESKKQNAKCETMVTNMYFLMTGFNQEYKTAIFDGGMNIFKDEDVHKRLQDLIPHVYS